MKKRIAVAVISILAVSCSPAYVLGEGTAGIPFLNRIFGKSKPKYNIRSDSALKPGRTEGAGSHYIPSRTLSDCYQLSLVQSELIAINTDLIKMTEAHFLQALSINLPHVSFQSFDFQQGGATIEESGGSVGASLKDSTRNFNYSQTLFSGFKAIAAIKGAGYERKQRTEEKTRAEQLLLVDVSNAFYLLIEKRQDIKVLGITRDALISRVKELQGRARLGRSRPSEIVNAKAQLYSVEASLEVAKSQEIIARQLLEFLIGQSVGDIKDTYVLPEKLLPEDYYLSKANYRPDVLAAKYAWLLSKEGVTVADSGFFPQVNVNANYYTQRAGFDKGTDWDVMLAVSVPLFDGALTLGNSKAANLQADQSMLLYHRTKRMAPYDIKNTYVNLSTAMIVCEAVRKAYTTARLNYHLQKKDYSRNLVNNLDVLAAIQTLQDSQRNFLRALYEAKRQYWQLRVAVGQSGTESLNDSF